ncbi:MAG TPA: alpha/beta fold hydrolase [Acidocella sp.]|nr:alpha/beta fold hydrolase [Acidocella sp.]HQU04263.1 alpha/beta fold hydrolase [Acidocella sp.]
MTDLSEIPVFDRILHAAEAKFTGGLSPTAIGIAWADWLVHLANQPGRQAALVQAAAKDAVAIWCQALGLPAETVTPPHDDRRFAHPGWQEKNISVVAQAFLRSERWWKNATTAIPGVALPHERIVSFTARQALDMVSPSNIALLNPEVIEATRASNGSNLASGLYHLMHDAQQGGAATALPLTPGKDVAITPGRVVFRNALIELLQYQPATETVRPEPILIVPAWIMKYYILDLSPQNSMIRYLVAQGFTVFCISWTNPSAALRGMGLDDYRKLGVMAAIDAASAICNSAKIHAAGYCLGGTLLSIAAAAMARDHDERLAGLTLLAAQTDFTEAGELQLFITEAQLAFLDDVMWAKGYLESSQMAGAFQMLRSNDLIWSRLIRRYYLGEEDHPNDMMSWNMDATRMPFRMHSEYLHMLFLNNDLAEGRLLAGGRKISVADIHVPFFVIGTETDHVAPWRSVYKIHLLNSGDITFVLTSGGHNAGVVSEPLHPHRHYRLLHRAPEAHYHAPEDWQAQAPVTEGSWWRPWVEWLHARSGPAVEPPAMGNEPAGFPALEAAPGQYIFQR